jgi:hypothetical protein
LFAPKQVATQGRPGAPSRKEVAWFENLLAGAKCWMTASDILLSVDRPVDDSGKRWLKALAAETVWVIGGQKGYRHVENASPEEINHAASRLESFAKVCDERARAIRSNAHRIIR